MDSFLHSVNSAPCHAMASLFLDDVVALAKSLYDLQLILKSVQQWPVTYNMVWNITKSCGLQLPANTQGKGDQLLIKHEAKRHGLALNKRVVADTKLIKRIHPPRGMLFKIKRVTEKWITTPHQRLVMVKTFVFSITDYLLYHQPMTSAVT